MAQITVAQHPALAGLLKVLDPSASGYETGPFAVQDDIEGEQEAFVPLNGGTEGPSQVSNILATVGDASVAVKDATANEYRR